MNSDCRVQCPKGGARGQMKDTAAEGIRATQGTFSSFPGYGFWNYDKTLSDPTWSEAGPL